MIESLVCNYGNRTLVDPLTPLDEVASLLVARAAPVQFRVAATAAERKEVFHLRYRAVVDRGWATPEAFPDAEERDAYDDQAVHIGGWGESGLVAAARLLFPDSDRRFPVEEYFGTTIEPRGSVVHVDRITIARGADEGDSKLLLALIARCWQKMRFRGFHQWAGIASPSMVRLYRRLGFDVTTLGPAKLYWGQERFPLFFDPACDVAQLRDRLGAQPRIEGVAQSVAKKIETEHGQRDRHAGKDRRPRIELQKSIR